MRKKHPEVVAGLQVFIRWCLVMVFVLPVTAGANDCSDGCRAVSRGGHFQVVARSVQDKPPLREYHDWILEVKDASGTPVELQALAVSGGMPGHGHGLPSQPRVSEYLGNGRYRLTGFLFNMHGGWLLRFHLVGQNIEDIADLTLTLDY